MRIRRRCADKEGVWRLIVLTLTAVVSLSGQQLASLERQRLALEKQRSTLAAGTGLDRQKSVVERQKVKAARQQGEGFFALPWPERPGVAAAFGCARLVGAEMEALVERSARDHSLAPGLLRAVVRRESGFYPCAVSGAGAMGLMQLMPATAAAMGVTNPFDPAQNIAGGSRFLRQMLERYGGNLGLALGAYNAGPGRVDRSGGIPPIRETQEYVRGILGEISPPE
jgi:soluble lytic murein transglycosylase-like protein